MDSVIESSCDLSMIFTANSCPVSLETHFLTVLERPLRGKVVRGMGGERGGERGEVLAGPWSGQRFSNHCWL